MKLKTAFLGLVPAILIQTLMASVSHAKLGLTVGSPQIDMATGANVHHVAPVEFEIYTLRYGSPTGFMPSGTEKDVFSAAIQHVADPSVKGWYMFSAQDMRVESAALFREMILSPQYFTVVVPECLPPRVEYLNSSRLPETYVKFPNGEVIPFTDLASRSIVAGRPTSMLEELTQKIRAHFKK